MASIFKTGLVGYTQDLEVQKRDSEFLNKFFLKVGNSKEVIFLDDTGLRFYMYSIMTPRGFAQFDSIDIICNTENPADCILSKCGMTPTYVTVNTVKDMTGYFKNTGERSGVGERQVLILKPTAAKLLNMVRDNILNNKANEVWEKQNSSCVSQGCKNVEDVKMYLLKKGNILKNIRMMISRTDQKASSVGNYFMPQRVVRQEELSPSDVPFDYEKIFKIKTDKEILNEVIDFYEKHGMPVTFGHLCKGIIDRPINVYQFNNQNVNNQGFNNKGVSDQITPNQGMMFENNFINNNHSSSVSGAHLFQNQNDGGVVASPFCSDDIPF